MFPPSQPGPRNELEANKPGDKGVGGCFPASVGNCFPNKKRNILEEGAAGPN